MLHLTQTMAVFNEIIIQINKQLRKDGNIMVTNAAYKIIKKAVILRINRGEDPVAVIDSYPKLSDTQRAQMLLELEEEGYISSDGE